MLTSFGDRLLHQRTRLGLSQTDICKITSVNRRTQYQYESGNSFPDARYLAVLMDNGFDVLYLLSGNIAPKIKAGEEHTDPQAIDEPFLRQLTEAVMEATVNQSAPLDAEKKDQIAALLIRIIKLAQL